jgi:hypothetical protein
MRFLQGTYFIIILLILNSCQQEKVVKQYNYFDLEGYFKKEALRLQKKNPLIEKRVSKNNDSEQRKLEIKNWNEELELFLSSDINKPAWKNSYGLQQSNQTINYIANDPDLRTQKISILKSEKNTIKSIAIFNKVNNSLYSSTEQLTYFPDSLYKIIKEQKVRILGVNHYTITGKINP